MTNGADSIYRKQTKRWFKYYHFLIHLTGEKRTNYIDAIILLQKLGNTTINLAQSPIMCWNKIWVTIHKLPEDKILELYKTIKKQ